MSITYTFSSTNDLFMTVQVLSQALHLYSLFQKTIDIHLILK